MAKKKSNDIFNSLADKLGGDVLINATPVKYFIDTGNLAFNWIISGKFMGGGIAGGRITEIFGSEASGKSFWGANIVRGCQAIGGISVYFDCESALNNEFVVKTSHIDLAQVLKFDPSKGADCLENCFSKIYNVIKAVRQEIDMDKPLIFVYDSLSASPAMQELAETELDFGEKRPKEQPGLRARICSREFRKLGALVEKTNTTLLVLNQTRMKIGVMYGSPEISGGGGEALKFYATTRIRTYAQKKIENKRLKIAMGVNLRVKNTKNRCHAPFLETEGVQLYWKDGVNPLSGLLSCLEQSERIEMTGKGAWIVKEPWANGQEVKFKASKIRNDIDPEVLYKCPSLIDAKDEQEVRDYMSIFGAAINQSLSEDNEETDLKQEYEEYDE